MKPPVVVEPNHLVRPSHIDTRNMKVDGTVDARRTEITVRWIISYAQSHGDAWLAFTRDDLLEYYRSLSQGSLSLIVIDTAIERGYLEEDSEGNLRVTDYLVDRFRAAWPVHP